MKNKILLLFLLITSSIYGNFQLAPQIQEINLDRPGTTRMYLKNETTKLKKIKIYPEIPEDQKSKDLYMGDWLVVYPKLVYLKPNSKKVIRMTARPPKDLKDGEYRSNLVFEEVPVKSYTNDEINEEKVGVDIDMLYVLVSTVYGNKGKLKYSGEFKDFKVVEDKANQQLYLTSKIINTGTSALQTHYNITYYEGKKEIGIEEIDAGKIMRENKSLAVLALSKISPKTTEMKVEYSYKLKRDPSLIREGEKEEEFYKLGEVIVPMNIVTKEEFLKSLASEDEKESEKVLDSSVEEAKE